MVTAYLWLFIHTEFSCNLSIAQGGIYMLNIAAFLSYVFVTSFTPGPNNIMSMTNAARYGFRRSIRFNFGILVGFFMVLILCSLFSAGLYRSIPFIEPVMKVIGAGYILWLAWKTYRSKPDHSQDMNAQNSFQAGLLLQFVNIKVILYGITIVSTFILPYYSSLPVIMAFTVFLALVGFTSTCCWALFGAVFQKFLSQHSERVNLVMSLLLVYCAVSLFL